MDHCSCICLEPTLFTSLTATKKQQTLFHYLYHFWPSIHLSEFSQYCLSMISCFNFCLLFLSVLIWLPSLNHHLLNVVCCAFLSSQWHQPSHFLAIIWAERTLLKSSLPISLLHFSSLPLLYWLSYYVVELRNINTSSDVTLLLNLTTWLHIFLFIQVSFICFGHLEFFSEFKVETNICYMYW